MVQIERWILITATIITTAAGPDMAIHNRQPVVLEQGTWDHWLDTEVTEPEELEPLLVATAAGTLVHHPVGKEVGNVRNDGPELMGSDRCSRRSPGSTAFRDDAGGPPVRERRLEARAPC